MLGDFSDIDALLDRRVENPRAVQMGCQTMLLGQGAGFGQIIERQDEAVVGVLQTQQAGADKVVVIRFNRRLDLGQVQRRVRLKIERLGLNAAQNGGPAAFIAIGVGGLSHDILIAATAVTHHAHQIALRAARYKQGRFFAHRCGRQRFQSIDGRVFAVNVVAHFGRRHGFAHGRTGQRDRIAA